MTPSVVKTDLNLDNTFLFAVPGSKDFLALILLLYPSAATKQSLVPDRKSRKEPCGIE